MPLHLVDAVHHAWPEAALAAQEGLQRGQRSVEHRFQGEGCCTAEGDSVQVKSKKTTVKLDGPAHLFTHVSTSLVLGTSRTPLCTSFSSHNKRNSSRTGLEQCSAGESEELLEGQV